MKRDDRFRTALMELRIVCQQLAHAQYRTEEKRTAALERSTPYKLAGELLKEYYGIEVK